MSASVVAALAMIACGSVARAQSALSASNLPRCSDLSAAPDWALDPATADTIRVLPVPDNRDLTDPHGIRCDVSQMAVAIRDNGNLRDIYYDRNGQRIPDDRSNPPKVFAGFGDQKSYFIDPVIAALQARIAALSKGDLKTPVKILIYAHGGLVSHKDAVLAAEALAPMMIRDGYAPLFLIWNNDLPISYADRLCCVRNGSADPNKTFNQIFLIPTRLFSDIGSSLAAAPANFVQEVIRYKESVIDTDNDLYILNYDELRGPKSDCVYFKTSNPPGVCDNIHFPNFGDVDASETNGQLKGLLNGGPRDRLDNTAYLALSPARVVSVSLLSQVGANAWDNMLRRTRLGFFAEYRRCPEAEGGIERTDEPIYCPDGGFKRFFAALQPFFLMPDGSTSGHFNVGTPDAPRWQAVQIEFYGHSMGAIVGDELISRFGDLPWSKVVYMAAADTIREFRDTTAAVAALQEYPFDFYTLSLHPLNESREREGYGILPQGSLLEWIDEMFNGPKTADDRTLGKWKNLEATLPIWPSDQLDSLNVRVMPEQAVLKGSSIAREQALFYAECNPNPAFGSKRAPVICHPLQHGDFNRFSFWRPMYQTGYTGHIDEALAR